METTTVTTPRYGRRTNGRRAANRANAAYAELDAIGGREYKTALEREALAAYRRELNQWGSVEQGREAFIEEYICQHS